MAHEYHAWIDWQRGEAEPFVDNRYSRVHRLRFDGGVELPGSASPSVVPLPYSSAAAVDPEEMFVASLSSCHMLWFLSLAAAQKFCVERYEDDALGTMARNAEGRMAMDLVVLRPRVVFSGAKRPDEAAVRALHHRAHDECFIANSVKTEVRCDPVFDAPA
ncbi:MAG: OsmC family protein [Burkholderiales bacterium]|nr:OsmC family protein [Burkholderiales bacterium]MDE2394974.1 OsmC family protein [Burkholderiales bacterium]